MKDFSYPLNKISIFLTALVIASPAAHTTESDLQSRSESPSETFASETFTMELEVYGAFHIRQFDYFKNALDLNPRQRRDLDLERVAFEPQFKFGSEWKIETEIEIEHGGVGTSMELDGFEEFGEFETELEQGGEVKLDKLEIEWAPATNLSYKTGLITVPVGMISQKHKPTEYFSVTRNRSEGRILPSTWRSVGLGLSGQIGVGDETQVLHQTVLVQGLNSEFFRKYNWIQDGAGRKFETTYADNLALATRWDFANQDRTRAIGVSIYYGDSSQNRQKVDKLTVEANVLIWDIHGYWESPTWTVRALYLRGYLQNSEEVSTQNATLGGAANPGAFAALGKEAELYFVEAGYNLGNSVNRFDLFARFDSFDPMKEVAGNINRDPRFRETSWTAGLAYKPRPELVAKLQYSQIRSGLDALPTAHEVMAGIGFAFASSGK